MRLSFTTFACPDWPLERILDAGERLGYKGIEFRCDARQAHGVEAWLLPAERQVIRGQLAKAGLEACCLGTSLQFAREETLEEAPSRMELAADLGCPAVRVFCGPEPVGQPRATTIDLVGRNLRIMAEHAESLGIEVWLETHDTFSHAAHAAAALRRADHPRLGLLYDNLHPCRTGEDLDATFAAIAPYLRHVHLHDGLSRPDQVVVTPLGQGQLPMDDIFDRLVKLGYDGYLGGEWFHHQYGPDPEAALDAYRQDMRELAQRHHIHLD